MNTQLSHFLQFNISIHSMQFTPSDSLIFQYKAGTHLPTNMSIKNTGSTPLGFKFKVTKPNKFHINPNVGMLKPGSEIQISIIIHRDIVDHTEDEKVQILYGDKYQQSRYFNLVVENGSKNDKLNLTMIVHQKEEEIKQIKKQISQYRNLPTNTLSSSSSKKGKSSNLTYIIAAIIALLIGYFVPFRLFEQ